MASWAAEVLQLLKMNQGNSSGNGIGCVSWDGEVYADQFWRHRSFGNVRLRRFSEIWQDGKMRSLKESVDKTDEFLGALYEFAIGR